MPEPQPDYASALLAEFNTKLRDMEEKHRLTKERTLLIGENLVEIREELGKELTDVKVQMEQAKSDILKIRETLQRILDELENRARRSELELLKKQARMFQPLELVRAEDVEKIISEKRGK